MERGVKGRAKTDMRRRLYRAISPAEYRVIRLLPGQFDDEIRCVLETRPTKLKSRYEALSYQWGEETNKRQSRIASLDFAAQQEANEATTGMLRSVGSSLRAGLSILQSLATRFKLPLQILIGIVASLVFMRIFTPAVVGKPDWVPAFVPETLYISLICILFGALIPGLVVRTFALVAEVVETKPWLLLYDFNKRRFQSLLRSSSNFETLEVTRNLALALQYLRQEKHARTLWIDALCINQDDAAEKRVEVQRMDWIFANASPILVWLGGYHDMQSSDACPEAPSQAGGVCRHQRDIQLAFDHIWVLSGWRLFLGWYWSADETRSRFQKSRSGWLEIAKRGWWERLWVVQEAALATGRVQLQLGNHTCSFGDFGSAQYSLLMKHADDVELKDENRACEHMLATIRDFRYSSFHDRGNPLAKLIAGVMNKTLGAMFRDLDESPAQFHEQSFHQKLNRILIKTSGHFKCREDRDRLYAVLGIVGGGATGKVTKLSNFIETLSSHSTHMVVAQQIDLMWKQDALSRNAKAACLMFTFACSLWAVFYDSRAKHWTINRPDYVVSAYRDVVDSVTGGSGQETSRAKFFTSLAAYLAKGTKSLAFLEAANCGEDEDTEMPSWVPNWSREVTKSVYTFISRAKKDQAGDVFEVSKDGKSITLAALPKGRLISQRSMKMACLQSSPFNTTIRKLLAMPNEGRRLVVFTLATMLNYLRKKPFSSMGRSERALLFLCLNSFIAALEFGHILLEGEGEISVYCQDGLTRRVGSLVAGRTAKGDSVVSVPGCLNNLVLRRRGSLIRGPPRWTLVGLVYFPSADKESKGFSKSEWAGLVNDKSLRRYTIE